MKYWCPQNGAEKLEGSETSNSKLWLVAMLEMSGTTSPVGSTETTRKDWVGCILKSNVGICSVTDPMPQTALKPSTE